jgi:hypothetical protein
VLLVASPISGNNKSLIAMAMLPELHFAHKTPARE